MKNYTKLAVSVLVCELAGIAATPFTINAVDTWYRTLNKPFFSPPNWIFGPVWTILYFMMGVSAYLIWIKGIHKKNIQTALKIFAVQLVLNFIWSLIFFGLQAPAAALIEIILLWLAIFLTIRYFYGISNYAAYLLIPYLLWVSFATVLNFSIVLLN